VVSVYVYLCALEHPDQILGLPVPCGIRFELLLSGLFSGHCSHVGMGFALAGLADCSSRLLTLWKVLRHEGS